MGGGGEERKGRGEEGEVEEGRQEGKERQEGEQEGERGEGICEVHRGCVQTHRSHTTHSTHTLIHPPAGPTPPLTDAFLLCRSGFTLLKSNLWSGSIIKGFFLCFFLLLPSLPSEPSDSSDSSSEPDEE